MAAAEPDLSNLFNAEIDRVAEDAIDAVGQAMPRTLSDIERRIVRSLFWARVAAVEGGDWVDVVGDGAKIRLALEPMFARGFVALAVRVLSGRRQPHLSFVAGAPA